MEKSRLTYSDRINCNRATPPAIPIFCVNDINRTVVGGMIFSSYNSLPRAYYLLGEDAKQYAVYYGAETDPLYVNGKPHLLANVYNSSFPLDEASFPGGSGRKCLYMYPGEYNVFGLGAGAPSLTYKRNAKGEWTKYYNVIDRMGSVVFDLEDQSSVVSSGAYNNYATAFYMPYGSGIIPSSIYTHALPNSRLSWVGKERDVESNLGDHGVRKYEPESGRFLSIDPLWEQFFAWTPYQYCVNDPVNKVDVDGKKLEFVVMNDRGDFVKASRKQTKELRKLYNAGKNYFAGTEFSKKFTEIENSKQIFGLMLNTRQLGFNFFMTPEGLKRSKYAYKNPLIMWSPYDAGEIPSSKRNQTPAMGLLHEYGHAVEWLNNAPGYNSNMKNTNDSNFPNLEERRNFVEVEKPACEAMGEPVRNNYDELKSIKVSSPTATK